MKNRKQIFRKNWLFVLLLVLGLGVIFCTRIVSIKHGTYLHPDERVFYTGADNLKSYLLGWSESFEELKEYPEGALVLQMPFHLLALLLSKLMACPPFSAQLIGRMASVVYFALGAILGCLIIRRFFSRNTACSVAYLLIASFSLMHIEQSRYATGDAMTFFLLMLMLYLGGIGLERKWSYRARVGFVFASFYVCGVLTATKYPLLYFIFIPIYAAVCLLRGKSRSRKIVFSLGAITVLLLGVAMFSPKAALDPQYIIRTCTAELTSYVVMGNTEMGGPLNHFLSVMIYAMLYSGFPLWPLMVFPVLKKLRSGACGTDDTRELFGKILPVGWFVFFLYNLFIKNLFMRTYYPFFFLGDLYAAVMIGDWLQRKSVKRYAAITLTALMAVRGAWLVGLMANDLPQRRLAEIIEEAVDDNWKYSTVLHMSFGITPENYDELTGVRLVYFYDDDMDIDSGYRMEQGELVVTGAMDYSSFGRYIIPLTNRNNDPIKARHIRFARMWEQFKENNQAYYVESVYPDWHYWILGNWIRGTTGTDYEFPSVRVYYRK